MPDELECCNSGCNPCILDVAPIPKQPQEPTINAIAPNIYTTFTLVKREGHTKTTQLLHFEYSDHHEVAPTGVFFKSAQYFLVRGRNSLGEFFTRAYTPLWGLSQSALTFIILLRLYENGEMSSLLWGLPIGGRTLWRGPYGGVSQEVLQRKYVGFVAQGTGIAPIYSLVREMVEDEECDCFLKVFFLCRDSNDVLLREELYKLLDYWNFECEIFVGEGIVERKYNEVIHERKFERSDLESYLDGKDCQVVVAGSEKFGDFIKTCTVGNIVIT